MSIILEQYKEKHDRVWYNSSNILYSECIDHENDLKDLIVIFNNGGTYKYKNVNVNDYLMFKVGGLDGSQGKAFNKFIKKYEFEKLENMDLNELEKTKILIAEEKEINTKRLNKVVELQEINQRLSELVEGLNGIHFNNEQYVILDALLIELRCKINDISIAVKVDEDFKDTNLHQLFRTLPWDKELSGTENINNLIKTYFN